MTDGDLTTRGRADEHRQEGGDRRRARPGLGPPGRPGRGSWLRRPVRRRAVHRRHGLAASWLRARDARSPSSPAGRIERAIRPGPLPAGLDESLPPRSRLVSSRRGADRRLRPRHRASDRSYDRDARTPMPTSSPVAVRRGEVRDRRRATKSGTEKPEQVRVRRDQPGRRRGRRRRRRTDGERRAARCGEPGAGPQRRTGRRTHRPRRRSPGCRRSRRACWSSMCKLEITLSKSIVVVGSREHVDVDVRPNGSGQSMIEPEVVARCAIVVSVSCRR